MSDLLAKKGDSMKTTAFISPHMIQTGIETNFIEDAYSIGFGPIRNDPTFVSIMSNSESYANENNFFTFRPVDALRHSRNLPSLGP